MKNIDRIAEAYSGELGDVLMEASRERLHWICSQAFGENILDVGCSQGTASIIIAREGKSVVGIDICQESIDYANESLEREDDGTRGFVKFVCTDFISYTADSEFKYDSIIMGEILEHLADPNRFVARAKDVLHDAGRLVITVPFGINDYHDHKRTYYLVELYKTINEFFNVERVEFLDSWIGMVGTKKNGKNIDLDEELFARAENAFLDHERKLLNNIQRWKTNADEGNKKYKIVTENYDRLKAELSDANKKLGNLSSIELQFSEAKTRHGQEREQFIEQLAVMTKELSETSSQMAEALANHSSERTELLEKVTLATSELGEALRLLSNSEAQVQRLRSQIDVLQKENSQYQWKINRITGTWYGKLALSAYRLLGRVKRRLFRQA